jgi:hypothetical protein
MIHAIIKNHFGMIEADLWLFERKNKVADESAKGENNGNNTNKLERRNR